MKFPNLIKMEKEKKKRNIITKNAQKKTKKRKKNLIVERSSTRERGFSTMHRTCTVSRKRSDMR